MALAATGSLRRLRKLDSALTATSSAAPAFLQLQKTETQVAERGADLEASLDKIRDELEELRKGLDEKVGAHQKRLDELHEELLPLQRDVASLVERSAAALDLPVSFLQVDQKHMPARVP